MDGLTKCRRWLVVLALLALGAVWTGAPRPALAQTQSVSDACRNAIGEYSAEWSAIFSGDVSSESISSIVPSLGAWLNDVQSTCTAAELESFDSQSLAQIRFLLNSLANCGAIGGTWSWDAGGCTIPADSSIVVEANQGLAGIFHLINHGTIENYSAISLGGSTIGITNYGTINNHSVIAITSGAPFYGSLGSTGSVNGFLLNYGTINNHDTIRTEGERFTGGDSAGIDAFGRFVNYGVINNDGHLLSNGGIIANGDSNTEGTINNDGDISNSSAFGNSGIINNDGEITTTSLFSNDGTINNAGVINIDGRFANGDTVASSTINNAGTINIFGLFGNSGLVRNAGTLYLEPMDFDELPNFVLEDGTILPFPYFENSQGNIEQDCAGVFNGATTWQFDGNAIVNVCPDSTPPVITADISGTQGSNEWYTS
ncbi:MAG: hypothetical protein R2851_20200 [Caldilineaceae bacterium]